MAKGFFTQGIVMLFDRAPTLDGIVPAADLYANVRRFRSTAPPTAGR